MNKYNARKTVVDGITFASKREADRYCELKLLEKAGEITDLRLQVKYELVPKTDRYRAINYIADFVYKTKFCNATVNVVEDVKGMRNQMYLLKRKLMYYRYGIVINEV